MKIKKLQIDTKTLIDIIFQQKILSCHELPPDSQIMGFEFYRNDKDINKTDTGIRIHIQSETYPFNQDYDKSKPFELETTDSIDKPMEYFSFISCAFPVVMDFLQKYPDFNQRNPEVQASILKTAYEKGIQNYFHQIKNPG